MSEADVRRIGLSCDRTSQAARGEMVYEMRKIGIVVEARRDCYRHGQVVLERGGARRSSSTLPFRVREPIS
jgi:hypothetical protein